VISIFESILNGTKLTTQQKVTILEQCELTTMLVEQGEATTYSHSTSNKTRLPNMGCIIKLANLVEKIDLKDVTSTIYTEKWLDFTDGEFASSNKNDNMTLGGQQKGGEISEDDENPEFDNNMESIMGRFNSFNSQMSGFSEVKDPGFDDFKEV